MKEYPSKLVAIVTGKTSEHHPFVEIDVFTRIEPEPDSEYYGTGCYMSVEMSMSPPKKLIDVRYERTKDLRVLAPKFMKGYYGRNAEKIELFEPVEAEAENERSREKLSLDETFEVIHLLDTIALFSDARVVQAELPAGLFAYDLHEGDLVPFETLEPVVHSGHAGTVIVKKILDLGSDGYIDLTEAEDSVDFMDDTHMMSVGEFLSTSIEALKERFG